MPYLNVGQARSARCAVVMLLALLGQSKHVNSLAVASAQPQSTASPCVVLPNLPLSIGFVDKTPMKNLQSPDNAIRDVLRGVKSWLCGPAATSQSLHADSLRSAIERRQLLLFDQIRFDTHQYKRAHVLITDSRVAAKRKHNWRVQVELANGTWRVAHATEAPSSLFRE